MVMNPTKDLPEIIRTAGQAYFPEPQFKVQSQYAISYEGYQFYVAHVQSSLVSMSIIDVSGLMFQIDPRQYISHCIQSAAYSIHMKLLECDQRLDDQWDINSDNYKEAAIYALLSLADLKVRCRLAEGVGDEDGKLWAIVKPGKWAHLITRQMLTDTPLESWQALVSTLLQRHAEPLEADA